MHFYGFTEDPKLFVELLEKQLLSKNYSEEDFNLYKKNIISDFYYCFNSVNGIMSFMMSEYEVEGKIDNKVIEIEKNLNYKEFIRVTDNINLDNKSIVVMKGE